MSIDKVMKTEYRELSDRVAINCKTYDEFEKIKSAFNLKFNVKNVWSKHKENTGINLNFTISDKGAVIYPNFGDITKSYKKDNYRIVSAQEILDKGISITDSGYNFVMAKMIVDLQNRIEDLESISEKE